jgi:hypothetical protein
MSTNDTFDKGLSGLIHSLDNTIKCHLKNNVLSSSKNPIQIRLNHYRKVVEQTTSEDHTHYFHELYTKNKNAILRGSETDSWLRTGNIVIAYGSEHGVNTKARIHLSAIYNNACKIVDEVETRMESGFPSSTDTFELSLVDTIMYFLYQIFSSVAVSKQEQDKLAGISQSLYGDVSDFLDKKYVPAVSGKSLMDSLKGMNGKGGAGGFEDIIKAASSSLGLGKEGMPDLSKMAQSMSGIFDRPETKSAISDIMQGLNGCTDIGDMAKHLVSKISDPNMSRQLSSVMNSVKDGMSPQLAIGQGGSAEGADGYDGADGFGSGKGEGDCTDGPAGADEAWDPAEQE